MAPIFECSAITGALVMTSILLADHHSLFRSGMAKLIDGIGGFTLAAEVDTGGPPWNTLHNTHQTSYCLKWACPTCLASKC